MNKWMTKLQKLDGAVLERKDRYAKIIASDSPSANFTYGHTHGLPLGYTEVLYGPPKGGKSVYSHMKAGWLHKTDPDSIVIKFDTEYRADSQLDDKAMALFGIDPERIMIIQTNTPEDVFDQIEQKVAALCQEGAPIKMIIVDSVSGVQGNREINSESVGKVTIGDHAQTIQKGLKRILPVIRKYDIALVLVCQVRSEMDQAEIMRGNKYKMQGSFGLQHMAEYFTEVCENRTSAGRKDLHGNELIDGSVTDLAEKGESIAKKIRIKMKDSSLGPKGRTGEFTFHFQYGVVNQYEEVFKLAINRNLVNRPNNRTYEFEGQSWTSKDSFIEALKSSPDLCRSIIAELKRRDITGEYAGQGGESYDEESASEPVEEV